MRSVIAKVEIVIIFALEQRYCHRYPIITFQNQNYITRWINSTNQSNLKTIYISQYREISRFAPQSIITALPLSFL